MRMAYFVEPPTLTWATPSMVEICRASMVSAYSSSWDGLSVSDHMAMKRIGRSAGLTLRKVGGDGMVCGSWRRGAADRGLHVLGGGVDVAVQVELDGDLGVALAR